MRALLPQDRRFCAIRNDRPPPGRNSSICSVSSAFASSVSIIPSTDSSEIKGTCVGVDDDDDVFGATIYVTPAT
jgi:hypothetical protein